MKHTIKYLTLIVLVTSASGCKKYLETAPDLRATLNTPAKVSELLTTAYPKASYITFCEAISDNADDKGPAASLNEFENSDPWFFRDVRGRDQDTPEYYWAACYKAIAAANQALDAIKNVSNPEAYSSQKGEALVARAYSHFMLVTLFSKVYDPATAATDPGIPYVLAPETVVIAKYERKTVAYVYEQIEKDLEEGIPLLTNQYTVPKYHFTPAAAHAFASRFYLFKKDYAKVIENADQVFPAANIAGNLRNFLVSSYRSMEPGAKSVYYASPTNPAIILLQEAQSYYGRNFASYRYSLSTRSLNQTIWANNVSGGRWANMVYGQTLFLNMRKYNEHFVLESQGGTIGDGYNMVPLFSAEEVLFNRAEANAYLGNTAAVLKDLNDYGSKRFMISDANPTYSPSFAITEQKINTFYAASDVQNGLVKTILDFKRVEFMFEGLRWFDILRHHLPVVHRTSDLSATYTLGPNDPMRVFQLPQEVEMSGIERNPR
ncbi:RagB/SusD family nutrient uptake outer membrane protein [Pedobacter sp. AW31-3R]|uniref:RagB/SusD family nutrient uptake outer membrane protein n=1 Tax=Pedobacter sp. AW31-3R TaxID=3445781 RepID=UPI003F9F47CB